MSSTVVLRDKWLSVRADACRLPSGHLIEPYYVLEYSDWVNVVALTGRQEVVLVRQFRQGLGRTVLELPGGNVETNDPSPLGAARRELLEETGYAGETFVATGKLSPNPATHNNMTFCYLATGVKRVADPTPDDTEEIEVVLMPLSEIPAVIDGGEFVQALHVSSLFLALRSLGVVDC